MSSCHERQSSFRAVAARIGEIAFQRGIMLHELATHIASLEEAFMELTADSVEYLAGEAR